MKRMNYFNPYDSKESKHEDQLTRAYMVLLKHSSHAFFTFFEYCRDKLEPENSRPSLSILDYIENDWIIETQKNNPIIDSDYLLSVLITDESIKNNISIDSCDRNARYDGIITFGNKLTMIIENKPISNNVWFAQLNPSKQNLSEDITIYRNPIILEWKEIIKHLNSLQSISTISGYEKMMINDFLSFIDENFTFLNPYDNFSLCKNEEILLYRRIENILKAIVHDPMNINYHRGSSYYINAQFEQIKQIGLNLLYDDNDWKLELNFCYADTQIKAKNFYKPNLNIELLKTFSKWEISTNFHVSFRSSGLVWFKSNLSIEEYIKYWIENNESIYQRKKEEVNDYLEILNKNNIIIYDNDSKEVMNKKFFNTAMQALNICPGFVMKYFISSKEAMEKDKNSSLEKIISNKIKEGLSIVGINWKIILK